MTKTSNALNFQQMCSFDDGERVWVKAITQDGELGTFEATVSRVDLEDKTAPLRVNLPRTKLEELGILEIVASRSASLYKSSEFTYWVDNIEGFYDGFSLEIIAVTGDTGKEVVTETQVTENDAAADLPVDPDAPLVSYYGKIYRNVKVANPNPDFAIIQDAETQEVRIAYLDTSDVFIIKNEMIEDIKKFGY